MSAGTKKGRPPKEEGDSIGGEDECTLHVDESAQRKPLAYTRADDPKKAILVEKLLKGLPIRKDGAPKIKSLWHQYQAFKSKK